MCQKDIPGAPGHLAELVGAAADGLHTISELAEASDCFEKEGQLAKYNKMFGKTTEVIKTGVDVVQDFTKNHVKAALFDAEMFNISTFGCPLTESKEVDERLQQMLVTARARFDAFNNDLIALESKMDAYNQVVAPWAADAADLADALRRPDLAGFEFSAGGQSAVADGDGAFTLRNLVARDDFGLNGPGTPRDLLSDDLFRVIGTRVV